MAAKRQRLEWKIAGEWRDVGTVTVKDKTVVVTPHDRGAYLLSRFHAQFPVYRDGPKLKLADVKKADTLRLVSDDDESAASVLA